MLEIKAIFSFWYLVQHTAGNPGGTKKAMRAQRTKLLFQFKKKTIHEGK
jgi:hypothetical protein